MSEFKVGDKVLVEAEIIGRDKKDKNYPYMIEVACTTNPCWTGKIYPIPTKTYEDGLREAWGLAREIAMNKDDGGICAGDLMEIFGVDVVSRIFHNFTVQEAADCVAFWKARHIHAGEIVTDQEDQLALVIQDCVGGDSSRCVVMYGSFEREEKEKDALTKTGRTIDIAGLLAQIGGVE